MADPMSEALPERWDVCASREKIFVLGGDSSLCLGVNVVKIQYAWYRQRQAEARLQLILGIHESSVTDKY